MVIATKRKGGRERLTVDKYFNLTEHAADGIAIIQDGVLKLVNTALCRIAGYDKEELLGMPFTQLLTPESQKLTMARYQARMAGKKVPPVYEIQAVTKDGEVRDIEINAALTEYEGRAADEVIVRDITERKQAEETLKLQKAYFQQLFDNSPEAIVLLDDKNRIVSTNKGFEMLYGYTMEKVKGRAITEVIVPEDRIEEASALGKAILNNETKRKETVRKRKDGSLVDVALLAYPIRLGSKTVGAYVIYTDITERKQAGEALQAEKNKLQSLVDAMEDGLTIQDKDYNIIYEGRLQRKIWGDHLGEKCYRVYEGREKVCERCPVKKAFKDGKSHTSERRVVMPSGEVIFWENTANPIRDAKGNIVSCLEIARNITERKKKEQLQQGENYVLTLLGQGANLSELLDAIVRLGEYNDPSTKGSVLLFDPSKSKELLFLASAPSLPDVYKELFGNGIPIGPKAGSCGTAAYLKERVIVTNIASSPLFKPFKEVIKRAINNSLLAVWSQPIIASNGDLLGTIANYSNKIGEPSADNLRALEWSARIAAIAIERKRAEEALRESQEFSSGLLESSPNPIMVLDPDASVRYVNPAFEKLSGFTLAEILGVGMPHPWWPEEYKEEMTAGLTKTIARGGKRTERIFQKKNGERFWVAMNSAKVVNKGKPLYFILNLLDITERKQAEEALQQSNKRFRDIAENALEWIWEVDAKGKYTYASPVVEKILGYKPEEVGKKHFYDLFHPDDREELKKAAFEAFAKKQPFHQFENRNICKNGKIVWLSTSGVPILDEEGNLLGYRGADVDITDRKQAEKQLQEKNEQLDAQNEELKAINEELQATEEELQHSQERLERMFESVTDGIVVANLHGTIIKVNEKAVQMHGFSSEDEMLGKNALELSAPRDHERIASNMRRALKEGAIKDQEYTLLRADGSEFPGELSTSVLKDASGKVIGHISIARDITKRKQMEKLFKTVTNSSPVGIYIFQDRKFQLANPQFQKLTGYTEDELRGMDSLSLVLPEDKDKVREKAIKMLKGKSSAPYQFRVTNKSGKTRWVMETVTSIQYRGRRAILGNYMDITERRQAEEREGQLQQELNLASRLASIGQLAAGVAHEINNPLTGVIGFSHLMMSRDIPDDMKQDLRVIHSEAQRVAKIVENLLIFAQQRKPGQEYVDINNIITRVLELRAYEMKVNNIEVESQLNPELASTMANAGQLQQVFLNIVLNAEHFMAKAHTKGKLQIKTEKIDGNIRASFIDDGSGISKENLDKIFNPFFTTKEVGDGTGLGLSICHSIISQHKGRIYAQSELGKGATFVVELPIVAEPAQTGKAKVTKKEPQKPRGAKILVVDDEVAILVFLKRLLTEWGHSVETINNANKALERLKTERYSLILLDIKLPGMSGIELYHHIEEIAPALTRRVMFITGDVMEAATRDFLEKTSVPHIIKPLDIEVLKKMLNRTLNQTQVAATAAGE